MSDLGSLRDAKFRKYFNPASEESPLVKASATHPSSDFTISLAGVAWAASRHDVAERVSPPARYRKHAVPLQTGGGSIAVGTRSPEPLQVVHSSSVRSLLASATRRARRRWARARRVMRGASASTVALQVSRQARKSCRPFLRCSPAHLPAPGETVAGVTIHLRNRKFAHKPHNRPLVFGR